MNNEELLEEIKDQFEDVYLHLSKNFTPAQKSKSTLSSRRLTEHILRVNIRYDDTMHAAKVMEEIYNPESNGNSHISQINLVDKIEAFHQQIYSALSAFVLMLNHYAPIQWKRDMPIKSIDRFLTFIHGKYNNQEFLDSLNYLNQSREFRAKFVDHMQQHIVHDWATVNANEVPMIVYYILAENEVDAVSCKMPGSEYEFPIMCKQYYWSPPIPEVYKSFIFLMRTVLEEFSDYKH